MERRLALAVSSAVAGTLMTGSLAFAANSVLLAGPDDAVGSLTPTTPTAIVVTVPGRATSRVNQAAASPGGATSPAASPLQTAGNAGGTVKSSEQGASSISVTRAADSAEPVATTQPSAYDDDDDDRYEDDDDDDRYDDHEDEEDDDDDDRRDD